jgi:hypothetical protein
VVHREGASVRESRGKDGAKAIGSLDGWAVVCQSPRIWSPNDRFGKRISKDHLMPNVGLQLQAPPMPARVAVRMPAIAQ